LTFPVSSSGALFALLRPGYQGMTAVIALDALSSFRGYREFL
jgi:hypothetical protein